MQLIEPEFELIENKSETRFVIHHVPDKYVLCLNKLSFHAQGDTYYRSFPGIFDNIAHIFANFKSAFIPMLQQQLEEISIPWEEALEKFLIITEAQDIHWWMLGTGALSIRGLDVEPHDLDLVTDKEGAFKLADLLDNYLIEPLIETEWIGRYFGRAFINFRIEWVGDIIDNNQWVIDNYGEPVEEQLEIVNWRGYEIKTAPLPLLLKQSKDQGLIHRVAIIERYIDQMNEK